MRESSSHASMLAGERGYTLMALLAVMTVLAITLTAAAPVMRQAAQREREREAIRRGEEVATAIREFVRYKGALPTSMDQLLEGVPLGGTRRVQILRPSAARDPLTEDGEWRLISPTDPAMNKLFRAITTYANNQVPQPREDQHPMLIAFHRSILATTSFGTNQTGASTSGGSSDATGTFIGVASRSQSESVLTYYGVERHNEWVFTPLFR